MIWWMIFLYVLAGVTIGRMAYEFDVFDPPYTEDRDQALRNREVEIWSSVITGVLWPLVPAWALWVYVRTFRS